MLNGIDETAADTAMSLPSVETPASTPLVPDDPLYQKLDDRFDTQDSPKAKTEGSVLPYKYATDDRPNGDSKPAFNASDKQTDSARDLHSRPFIDTYNLPQETAETSCTPKPSATTSQSASAANTAGVASTLNGHHSSQIIDDSNNTVSTIKTTLEAFGLRSKDTRHQPLVSDPQSLSFFASTSDINKQEGPAMLSSEDFYTRIDDSLNDLYRECMNGADLRDCQSTGNPFNYALKGHAISKTRKWTDQSGQHPDLEGFLQGVDEEDVFISIESGEFGALYVIPIAHLSKKDMGYIKRWKNYRGL